MVQSNTMPAELRIGLSCRDINCQHLLGYSPTPVQEIHDPLFEKAGVRVLVKREDLNHPYVSGNKWWKLKYNLEESRKLEKRTLLTFGGAYSNHIFATAAAAHELGFESIGVIRGEETLPLNPTLTFAVKCGMKIHYVSRGSYRKKMEPQFIQQLHDTFGDFYLIPEGGTNELAVKGVAEFAGNLLTETDFDTLCLSVGTGGTMAGIINAFKDQKVVMGFPALKGGEFLSDEIRKYLISDYGNRALVTSYHHGGYGKVTPDLLDFMEKMRTHHNLPLDSVYTAKMFWGVMKEIEKGSFAKATTVLVLHTGGLQT
jgi:1-aminocyclopropane-1-carboxylate deaminase